MKPILPSSKIKISPSLLVNAGRGVFATQDIKQGDVIEQCPVIVFSKDQTDIFKDTALRNYYFWWGEESRVVAVALGYGTLYNHSYIPNARYNKFFDNQILEIVALKDITQGEEITIHYNGDPANQEDTDTEGVPSKFS